MILDKNTGLTYGELKETFAYMLKKNKIRLYKKEEEFQWTQSEFLTYILEAIYCQTMEVTGVLP